MAILEVRASFPCGYSYRYRVRGLIHFKIDDKDFPICPLHKEKCKAK